MLLLDVGNSRCKWARVRDGAWTHQGVFGNTEPAAMQSVFSTLPRPSRILVSNVAGAQMAERLHRLFTGWDCPIEFVTPRLKQCGLRNAYHYPERLGSDRWAAMIAAWHQVRGACLVVNLGTATTVDAISAQGEFIGGLILPGVYLMRQSLLGNTAQLEVGEGALIEFPLNTEDAIQSGLLRATLGAIQSQFALLVARHPDARCVVSGGGAEVVCACLDIPHTHRDNLVLQGLQIIGENKE